MSSNKFVKDNLILVGITSLSILLNFLSQLIIANYFGTTFNRDAYFIAFSIPSFVNIVVTNSIVVTFLPAIVNARKRNEADAPGLIGATLFLTSGSTLLLFGFLSFIASDLIWILAPSFTVEQNAFTTEILRVLMLGFAIQSLNNLIAVSFHAKQRFVIPALQPLITALCSILFVVLFHGQLDIMSLAWGYVVGNFAHSILLYIKFSGAHLKDIRAVMQQREFRDVFILAFPLFMSGIFTRAAPLIERHFASALPQGSVSYLGYASHLMLALTTLASNSIATTIYPMFVDYWHERRFLELSKEINKGMKLIFLIACPVIMSFVAFGESIVQVLFQRGAFTHSDTINLNAAIVLMLGYFLFTSLGNVLGKVMYCAGKTTLASVVGIFEIVLYFTLSYFLSQILAFKGLALALSVSTGFTVFIFLFSISKFVVGYNLADAVKIFLQFVVISVVSMAPVYAMSYFGELPAGLTVFGLIPLFFVVFFYLCFRILRIEELILIGNFISGKFLKKTD